MKIEQSEKGNVLIITITGVIKLSESGKELSNYLKTILETGSKSVLVDLSHVEEVDSTGLGEFVAYLKLFAKQGRQFVLVKPTDRIRHLLEFVNLHRVLPIFDNINEALEAISGREVTTRAG